MVNGMNRRKIKKYKVVGKIIYFAVIMVLFLGLGRITLKAEEPTQETAKTNVEPEKEPSFEVQDYVDNTIVKIDEPIPETDKTQLNSQRVTIKAETVSTKAKTVSTKTKAVSANTVSKKGTSTEAKNYISIPSVNIEAKTYVIDNKTSGTQNAVDTNDVCIDTNRGDEDVKLLYGHNYNSFKNLKNVKVGDTVYLTEDGKQRKYKVYYSDYGYLTDNKRNILDRHTNEPLLKYSEAYCNYTKQEDYAADEPILQMYTCYKDARWVVLAKPF